MKKIKKRTIQRERRIYHGEYLTVHVFPIFQKAGKRSKKSKPSTEVQKKLNQKYREEKLMYLLDENFTSEDLEIGLGFDDEHLPDTYEDVQRCIRNYIRRLKRYRTKNNLPELKYIYTIERGAKNGRWHAHMVMNGDMDRDTVEEIWGNGYAHSFRLHFDDEGLKGLAKYKVKEPQTENERINGKVRRWSASKNLKQPRIPPDRDGFISGRTVKDIREGSVDKKAIERLYPGYRIINWTSQKNVVNFGEYLTIQLRKDKYIKRE